MRRLIPFALLLAAACAHPPSTSGDATAFDPESAERTLDWVAATWREVGTAPKDNAAARKEAFAKLGDTFRQQAAGQNVRWAMRVDGADAERNCLLRPVSKKGAAGGPEVFVLYARAEAPAGKGDHGGDHTALFQSSPPKADWVLKLAAGDPVILAGKLKAIIPSGSKDQRGGTEEAAVVVLAGATLERP